MDRRNLSKWLAAIVLIDTVGLACVGATWALAGGGDGGLGPYLQAVGAAATSPWSLLQYCLLIAGYSAALELVLRLGVQRPLSRLGRVGAHLAGPTAALAYGLTHAIYHPAGVVYALVLGSATATAYAWVRDWRPLAVWHVQWNAIAIAGTLLLALWGPGDAQTAVLVAYKAEQIEEGNLFWLEGWGWVDRSHYAADQLERALSWAEGAGADDLEFRVKLTDVMGVQRPFSRTYQRPSGLRNATERWAVACAAVLDFNRAHEEAQDSAPWWTGSRTSAFQFDDLPSVLLACLHAHPEDGRVLPPRGPASELTVAKWRAEGPTRVTSRVRTWTIPEEATNRATLQDRLRLVLDRTTLANHLTSPNPEPTF